MADHLDLLDTERHRPGLEDLDRLEVADVVSLLLEAEAAVPRVMRAAHAELTAAATVVAERIRAGGRLIYVGAGTPGRIAAADAAECAPTYGVEPGRVVALTAAEASARTPGSEAAEDDIESARVELDRVALTADDVVVGIAASGRTPFMIEALRLAREQGVTTVAVTNNAGSVAAKHADITIELLTGPEVVAGSTRLAAGTSQKIALNVLSTAALVATGHTYGPWMVNMQAVNGKLRRRAVRVVREITGAAEDAASAALAAAESSIKTASLMLTHGVDRNAASVHLAAHGDDFRAAMQARPAEP
jgi:N-acetylmuramic acid 6-phosphate etherase